MKGSPPSIEKRSLGYPSKGSSIPLGNNHNLSTGSNMIAEEKNDGLISLNYTRMNLHWSGRMFLWRERQIHHWGYFKNI
jgi:hypothetical protein